LEKSTEKIKTRWAIEDLENSRRHVCSGKRFTGKPKQVEVSYREIAKK
jgi:hypothetical protein